MTTSTEESRFEELRVWTRDLVLADKPSRYRVRKRTGHWEGQYSF
jgi:hypothetical protein